MQACAARPDGNLPSNEFVSTMSLMWILGPSSGLIKRCYESRFVTLDDDIRVPVTYIRHFMQQHSETFKRSPPTHIPYIIAHTQEVRQFPVHDIVLGATGRCTRCA